MWFKKVTNDRWVSVCGNYSVERLREPTPEGMFQASRIDWNHYLGTGTKDGMMKLCSEHDLTN